jgi:hypothetical protein
MSFIRSSTAAAPVINGLDANAYINSLPNVGSRSNTKRPPMGNTNLTQKSVEIGCAVLSVAGGIKPVTAKLPAPPPKSAALPAPHWTQRNACSTRAGGSLRARSVDAAQGRGAPAPVAAGVALSLTASHMSPIKQSQKGYQAEISRAKPETSKDVVEEMQRKAKARADSWRLKILADANSVRARRICARLCCGFSRCNRALCDAFQAEAQREAARKLKEQVRRLGGGLEGDMRAPAPASVF